MPTEKRFRYERMLLKIAEELNKSHEATERGHTLRACCAVALSDEPIRSAAQLRQTYGVGEKTLERLQFSAESESEAPPARGLYASLGPATLVALLGGDEEGNVEEPPERCQNVGASPARQVPSGAWSFAEVDRRIRQLLEPTAEELYDLGSLIRGTLGTLVSGGWSPRGEKLVDACQRQRQCWWRLTAAGRKVAKEVFEKAFLSSGERASDGPLHCMKPVGDGNGLMLLIDDREGGRLGLRELTEFFRRARIPFETRHLSVGDYMFVYRVGEAEYVMPLLVERKSAADVGESIYDGRIARQERRMRQAMPLLRSVGDSERCRSRMIVLVEGRKLPTCSCGCTGTPNCIRDGYPRLVEAKALLQRLDAEGVLQYADHKHAAAQFFLDYYKAYVKMMADTEDWLWASNVPSLQEFERRMRETSSNRSQPTLDHLRVNLPAHASARTVRTADVLVMTSPTESPRAASGAHRSHDGNGNGNGNGNGGNRNSGQDDREDQNEEDEGEDEDVDAAKVEVESRLLRVDVATLKLWCKQRGLKRAGTKRHLVDELLDAARLPDVLLDRKLANRWLPREGTALAVILLLIANGTIPEEFTKEEAMREAEFSDLSQQPIYGSGKVAGQVFQYDGWSGFTQNVLGAEGADGPLASKVRKSKPQRFLLTARGKAVADAIHQWSHCWAVPCPCSQKVRRWWTWRDVLPDLAAWESKNGKSPPGRRRSGSPKHQRKRRRNLGDAFWDGTPLQEKGEERRPERGSGASSATNSSTPLRDRIEAEAIKDSVRRERIRMKPEPRPGKRKSCLDAWDDDPFATSEEEDAGELLGRRPSPRKRGEAGKSTGEAGMATPPKGPSEVATKLRASAAKRGPETPEGAGSVAKLLRGAGDVVKKAGPRRDAEVIVLSDDEDDGEDKSPAKCPGVRAKRAAGVERKTAVERPCKLVVDDNFIDLTQ